MSFASACGGARLPADRHGVFEALSRVRPAGRVFPRLPRALMTAIPEQHPRLNDMQSTDGSSMSADGRGQAPRIDGNELIVYVLASLRRYWRSSLLVGLAVLACGAVGIIMLSPKYVVTATVAVTSQRGDPLSVTANGQDVISDDLPATIAAHLAARDIVAQVARDHPQPAPKPRLGLKGFICRHSHGRLFCPKPVVPQDPEAAFQSGVDALMANLTVLPEVHSRVIDLTIKDANARHAADVLNDLVTRYVQSDFDAQVKDLNEVVHWLDGRTDELRERWLAAVRKADEFDVSHHLVNGVGGSSSGSPLIAQQIAQVSAQISDAQARQAAAQAKAAALYSADRGDPRAAIALGQQPVLVAAANELMQLRAERDSESAKLGPQHPAIRALDRQISAAQASLSAETSVASASIRSDAAAAAAEVASLKANLDRLRGESGSQSAPEAVYHTLVEEADSAKAVYDTFLDRSKALTDRAQLVRAPVEFVSRAVAPLKPNFPNRRKLAAGLVVVAVVVALGTSLLRSFLAVDFDTVASVRETLGAPVLGAIGRFPRNVSDVRRSSSLGEAAVSLAGRLGLLLPDAPPRTVLVVSSVPGEDSLDIAILLAGAVVGERRSASAVVVNAGLPDAVGDGPVGQELREICSSRATAEKVLQDAQARDHAMHVPVVGMGLGTASQSDVRAAIANLSCLRDCVIFAGPPVLGRSEALMLAELCDTTVLVVKPRFASRASVAEVWRQIEQRARRPAGVVVSGVDLREVSVFGSRYSIRERRLLRRRNRV